MTNANITQATTDSDINGGQAIEIRSDSKKVAQSAIQTARAWIKANGGKSKLVSFYEITSEYSNLVTYYRARVFFVVPA